MTYAILLLTALVVSVLLTALSQQNYRMKSRQISFKTLTNSAYIMITYDVYWMKVKNVYGHKVWVNVRQIGEHLEARGLIATFEYPAAIRRSAERYRRILSEEE